MDERDSTLGPTDNAAAGIEMLALSVSSPPASRSNTLFFATLSIPLIISAAFSAIMIVGAFVLPEVTCGITEASATRYFVLHLEDFIKADPTSLDVVNGPFPNNRTTENFPTWPQVAIVVTFRRESRVLLRCRAICPVPLTLPETQCGGWNLTISMDTKTDWRAGLTASGCLKYLGDEKLLTDVKFIFPNDNNESCTGHKLILSMRSAVFEAMFYGPLATEDGEITISDIEKKNTFEMVLRYVYSDELEVDGDTVLRCLYAAKKYCLDGMVRFCSDFLESSVTIVNG
ncbi:BTB6B-like protein [Mya arenaria]|uniref:BTB6B-like protein n=1 Tax=Mya arenaria TaxID=6604 RepID=A0ABY7EMB6_MYAAR|nr:BTB6B-like protein [Mya arenaria]